MIIKIIRRLGQSHPSIRRGLSHHNKHPILTQFAKGAGIKAAALRNAESDLQTPSIDTLLSHAGLPSHSTTTDQSNAPITPPLHLSSTYIRPASGEYGSDGLIYTRTHNPTRNLFEQTIAQLETMQKLDNPMLHRPTTTSPSIAFSSGMAAVSAIFMASASPLHVILPDDVYWGVPNQLLTIFQSREDMSKSSGLGISHSVVDMTRVLNIEQKMIQLLENINHCHLQTILVWIETPSNPQCKVIDIASTCECIQKIRKSYSSTNIDIMIAVDSTMSPPNITQPLLLGADLSLHSATKYIGGHSDLLLGVVTPSPYTLMGQKLASKLRTIQTSMGAVASPFDCWLALRGLRTLHLRVHRQCQSALLIATFLSNHPWVEKVHYPGLNHHPQHDIASQQMHEGLFGGVLSFEVQDEVFAMAVAGAVKVITRATSLGGTETLIEHRATIEPAHRVTSPRGLLRLSVGLEDAQDLVRDLDRALLVAHQLTIK